MIKVKYLILLFIVLSCRKELDISEFSFNFSNYSPELRIEALILPHDSTAIVRIDKSFLINDVELYDCKDNDFGIISQDSCNSIIGAFWHGIDGDLVADCGDWNPYLHDIGIDGLIGDPTDEDGDCESFTDTECREENSIGEQNGKPDCGEPNVDNLSEILPNIHEKECDVSIHKVSESQVCEFIYHDSAGKIYDEKWVGNGQKGGLIENVEIVNYGGYVPHNCDKSFWIDYDDEYTFTADCSSSGYDIINSSEPIKITKPVVFFTSNDSIEISQCDSYSCLKTRSSIYNQNIPDTVYFGRYASDKKIYWANMLPNVAYQVVQYMYDEINNQYIYYHGHPGFALNINPDLFFSNNIAIASEAIVTEYYDGYGNGYFDGGDLDGDGEIYADENLSGEWDDSEIFIDLEDKIGDIDIYYYEIFTFSDSYRNYYFFDELYLDDLERSNLRDSDNNPVMGAFGSMTSSKLHFRIIDCTNNMYGDQEKCENNILTHSVCQWKSNISLYPCTQNEEDITPSDICLPVDFSIEDCD